MTEPREALAAALTNSHPCPDPDMHVEDADIVLSALAAEGWVLVRAAEPAPKMMLNGKMNPDYLTWNEQHRLACGTCGKRLRDHIEGVTGHAFVRTFAQGVTLTREPGLDVERLALAIATVEEIYPPRYSHDARAHDIAATYAALASEDRP